MSTQSNFRALLKQLKDLVDQLCAQLCVNYVKKAKNMFLDILEKLGQKIAIFGAGSFLKS